MITDWYKTQLEIAVDQAKLNLRSAELELQRYSTEAHFATAGMLGAAGRVVPRRAVGPVRRLPVQPVGHHALRRVR